MLSRVVLREKNGYLLSAASLPFAVAKSPPCARRARRGRLLALKLPVVRQQALEATVQRLCDFRPLFEATKDHRRSLNGGQAIATWLTAKFPVKRGS